ncbi:MAG: porin family protein [Mesorhizobium sp.]|nr:outer membrane protein [Mesorhizobium sp.]MBL8580064.1 porin family protein [Mesorhizobium sp.]
MERALLFADFVKHPSPGNPLRGKHIFGSLMELGCKESCNNRLLRALKTYLRGHMRIHALAVVLALGASVPAVAADATVDEVIVVDTAYDWSGVYVGVQGGYSWGANKDVALTGDSFFVYQQEVTRYIPFSVPSDVEGLAGGAQIGYNFQSGSLVYGGELDFQFGPGGEANEVCAPYSDISGYCYPASTVVSELKWLATARGRIGHAFDRTLFYATAGLAVGEVYGSYGVRNAPSLPYEISMEDSSIRFGWTAGVGAQYAITERISLKGEYLYYDLADQDADAFYSFGPYLATATFSNDGHIVRVGVNYKF